MLTADELTADELESQRDLEVRPAMVARFQQTIDTEPGAGAVCICFNRIIADLLKERLGPARRQTILAICGLARQRPFPTLLWARLVENALDRPDIIERGLARALSAKHLLRDQIRSVAETSAHQAGFRRGATLVVYGYSATIVEALQGLPDGLRRTLTVLIPLNSRRAREEVRLLEERLHDLCRIKASVIDNEAAVDRIREGDCSLFVTGATVIGLADHQPNGLRVVSATLPADLRDALEEAQTPRVVVSGVYKVWPKDLFATDCLSVVESGRFSGHSVTPGSAISCFMTADGVFSPEQFVAEYAGLLKSTLATYPGWSLADGSNDQSSDVFVDDGRVAFEFAGGPEDEDALASEAALFARLVADDQWFAAHAGKHVAIVGDDVMIADDLETLSRTADEKYPDRDVFISPVSRDALETSLGPRIAG
jgi:hypothetical protein